MERHHEYYPGGDEHDRTSGPATSTEPLNYHRLGGLSPPAFDTSDSIPYELDAMTTLEEGEQTQDHMLLLSPPGSSCCVQAQDETCLPCAPPEAHHSSGSTGFAPVPENLGLGLDLDLDLDLAHAAELPAVALAEGRADTYHRRSHTCPVRLPAPAETDHAQNEKNYRIRLHRDFQTLQAALEATERCQSTVLPTRGPRYSKGALLRLAAQRLLDLHAEVMMRAGEARSLVRTWPWPAWQADGDLADQAYSSRVHGWEPE